jgi:probable phosphoglycerate mutase
MHDRAAELQRFMNDSENWRIEGAETFAQVRDRAVRCLEEIASAHEGQRIAVVSHGVTIRCILWKLLGIRLQDMADLPVCQNTAVTKLFYENGSFLVSEINDAAHLQKITVPAGRRVPNLRGERFDPARDPDYYTRCYADAWAAAHGNLRGYDPMVYLTRAKKHHAADEDTVLRIFDGEESVGLIDLDPERGSREGRGWISLLYLREDYRHRGCGPQLLGRALITCEKKGRSAVRLSVADSNRTALAFYERNGFVCVEEARSEQGKLLYMERQIGRRGALYGSG